MMKQPEGSPVKASYRPARRDQTGLLQSTATALLRHLGSWLEGSQGTSYQEPIRLNVRFPQAGDLGLRPHDLRYLLDQLPELQRLCFDAWPGDPLAYDAVGYWRAALGLKTPHIESGLQLHLRTAGYGLLGWQPTHLEEFFEWLPQRVTLVLPGHTPSQYGLYGKRSAQEFPLIIQAFHKLLTLRKHAGLTADQCLMDICFWVEPLNIAQMHAMVYLAEQVGADAVCFQPLPGRPDIALHAHDPVLKVALEAMDAKAFRLPVALPPLLAEWPLPCTDPFSTVALDLGTLATTACSQWHSTGGFALPALWDGDYWNSPHFCALRRHHAEVAKSTMHKSGLDKYEAIPAKANASEEQDSLAEGKGGFSAKENTNTHKDKDLAQTIEHGCAPCATCFKPMLAKSNTVLNEQWLPDLYKQPGHRYQVYNQF